MGGPVTVHQEMGDQVIFLVPSDRRNQMVVLSGKRDGQGDGRRKPKVQSSKQVALEDESHVSGVIKIT